MTSRTMACDLRVVGPIYSGETEGILPIRAIMRGSVVSSWLLDLTASALLTDPKLAKFEDRIR